MVTILSKNIKNFRDEDGKQFSTHPCIINEQSLLFIEVIMINMEENIKFLLKCDCFQNVRTPLVRIERICKNYIGTKQTVDDVNEQKIVSVCFYVLKSMLRLSIYQIIEMKTQWKCRENNIAA